MTSNRRSHSSPMSQAISIKDTELKEPVHGVMRCRIPRIMSPVLGQTPKKETRANCLESSRPRSALSRRKELSPLTAAHAPNLRQTRSEKERPTPKRPSHLSKTLPPFRPPKTVINIPISKDLARKRINSLFVNSYEARLTQYVQKYIENEHSQSLNEIAETVKAEIFAQINIPRCILVALYHDALPYENVSLADEGSFILERCLRCVSDSQYDGSDIETMPSGQELKDSCLVSEVPSEMNQNESYPEDERMQLKIRWQDNIVKYNNIKRQLNEQQYNLLELYATLHKTHEQMLRSGQTAFLPPSDDLKIMNVSKLTPEQLLQLCAGTLDSQQAGELAAAPSVNMDVLYEIPNKIMATCEQTLYSRQAIIDWFEEMVQKKMVTKAILVSKINHFKMETNEFKDLIEKNKQEYVRVLNETGEILKKNENVSITNQLRSEDLASKLSELNEQNQDLRKKLRLEQMSCITTTTTSKSKTQELEKELKEEKCKKASIRDRLSKADIQIKIKEEQITRLKADCDEAKSIILSLENTVSQLSEENQILQSGCDKKMQKLNESIDKNTKHLEEIMVDRSKLLTEKKDLEERLLELSKHYEEALRDTKHEKCSIIAKVIEIEKKYDEIREEKNKLEEKVGSLCAQLLESELRFKEVSKKLSEVEFTASDVAEMRTEMQTMRCQLTIANKELLEYKESTAKQTEALKELEKNFKTAVESEEILKNDINYKEKYIVDLEKQRASFEQRLEESESLAASYAVQISNLKNHISQLQEDFGEFENWEELYEKIKQQSMKLREAIQQISFLTQAIKKKEIELQQQVETVREQAQLLEERDAAIKTLAEKDQQNTNLIKLLRDNLEMRTQADIEFNQQILEKNTEIESLTSNIEKKKQQTSQLEKIILALENQNLKLSNQKRKACHTIVCLEQKLSKFESYYTAKYTDSATENLDDLIDILEQELSNPLEKQCNRKRQDYIIDSRTLIECQQKQRKYKTFISSHPGDNSGTQSQKSVPTKIVMGNYVKKTYIPNEDKDKGDNRDRKKAITNVESSEWEAPSYIKPRAATPCPKNKKDTSAAPVTFPVNIPYCLIPKYIRDEKKLKMFKFAGHKL